MRLETASPNPVPPFFGPPKRALTVRGRRATLNAQDCDCKQLEIDPKDDPIIADAAAKCILTL